VGRVLCLRARRSLNESSNHRLRSERRAIGRSVRSKPITSAKYAANPARGERVAAQKRKRERGGGGAGDTSRMQKALCAIRRRSIGASLDPTSDPV